MTTNHTINGNDYTLIAWSFSNSRNWGHKAQLFKNNDLIAEDKCIYYNRTWESYQYQSVMQCTIQRAMTELEKDIFDDYRQTTGKKRLSAKIKVELLENDQDYKELKELYSKL